MSVYHTDKCDKQTALELKEKVIALLATNGIDASKIEIKCLTCYGGDVRVYLGINERTSTKTRFRRTEAKKENGNVVGYYGTRGKHEIRERDYVVFNAEDFTETDNLIEYNIFTIKKYFQNATN